MKDFFYVLENWKDFSGRARRREYWMYMLFLSICSIIIGIIGSIAGIPTILSFIFTLVTILPSIAVNVRRMHDIGKSGYWLFICFIPLIGSLWFLFLAVQDGQPGTNQYGANPKEAA